MFTSISTLISIMSNCKNTYSWKTRLLTIVKLSRWWFFFQRCISFFESIKNILPTRTVLICARIFSDVFESLQLHLNSGFISMLSSYNVTFPNKWSTIVPYNFVHLFTPHNITTIVNASFPNKTQFVSRDAELKTTRSIYMCRKHQ